LPIPDLRRELGLVARFASAGVVNTLVGASVILCLDLGLKLPPAAANAAGYAAGFLCAWFMHRGFVFRASQTDRATNLRYVAVMALAFAANQAMLTLLCGLVGPAPIARAAAQMAAIVTYTALQFVLMRIWVFRPRPL